MRVVSIVGARPQFIKAAMVSRVLRQRHEEILLHTGQHYDFAMSAIFFEELALPAPDVNLEVGSGPHGAQTGAMLEGIERVLLNKRPDWVIVYGDTNSTLAGALAAAKLGMRVAHVEAGLRSFKRSMPEEINRIVADHLSSLLLCPTKTAVNNLAAEGIAEGVHLVGDVMADALSEMAPVAKSRSRILEQLGLADRSYFLATVHRAENTDDPARLSNILQAFDSMREPVVFPVHPRTQKAIQVLGYAPAASVRLIDPLGYVDMLCLLQGARAILTDSGGLQKEAYWLGVPCITLRDETEWVETLAAGCNVLVGADATQIVQTAKSLRQLAPRPRATGHGAAASRICEVLAAGQSSEVGKADETC